MIFLRTNGQMHPLEYADLAAAIEWPAADSTEAVHLASGVVLAIHSGGAWHLTAAGLAAEAVPSPGVSNVAIDEELP